MVKAKHQSLGTWIWKEFKKKEFGSFHIFGHKKSLLLHIIHQSRGRLDVL